MESWLEGHRPWRPAAASEQIPAVARLWASRLLLSQALVGSVPSAELVSLVVGPHASAVRRRAASSRGTAARGAQGGATRGRSGAGVPLAGLSRPARAAARTLDALRASLEAGGGAGRDGPIADGVREVARLLGLGAVEADVLLFVAVTHLTPMGAALAEVAARAGSDVEQALLIAEALGAPPASVVAALAPDGPLRGAGLLAVGAPAPWGLAAAEPRLAPSMVRVCASGARASVLLDDVAPHAVVLEGRRASVGIEGFAHLGADVALLRRRLVQRGDGVAAPLRVLVHGPPGVGKSAFVRALAASEEIALHEVRLASADGTPLDPDARLTAFCRAQRLLERATHAAIVFESLEDLVSSSEEGTGVGLPVPSLKASVAKALEDTRVPSFFITARIEGIDPFVLRRFDYVLPIPAPPVEARRAMLSAHLDGVPVDAAWLDRAAQADGLTPGEVARAARFVRALALDDAPAACAALDRALSHGASRGLRAPSASPNRLPYDAHAIRTSVRLDALAEGLAREGRGTVLFSGPPGTGKTEAARELAQRLGRPLRVRAASELLSKWVGDTERNLASAFAGASADGAVLLLDEVDSFLRPRAGAARAWEVTQVNELLVQIERFDGILVCTTNFLEGLDPAALRRFAVKVRFEAPDASQRWRLVLGALDAIGVARPSDAAFAALRARVDALTALAPGHVEAVARAVRLVGGVTDAESLVARLEQEHALDPAARRPVGFGA